MSRIEVHSSISRQNDLLTTLRGVGGSLVPEDRAPRHLVPHTAEGDCCLGGDRGHPPVDAGIGAKATVLDCMGGDGEGNCASRKRDMAWSEDAGRERTKAWMQASDEGNGLV